MKAPAFQFYPTDYIASQRVQMLTLEEEGAYVRLLCYCWQHGSIPSDVEQLARLIGKGASTTLAAVVAAMFQPTSDGSRLVHDRLEREKAKQDEWRAKSAAGGLKSAEKRKGGAKGGSTVVQPPNQPNGNIPSSVSVSNKEEEERGAALLLASEVQHSEPFWSKETNWRGITAEQQKRWALAYPACNVERQLAQMNEWLLANPAEANKSAWARFVANWLKREQDKGGDKRADRKTNYANNRPVNSRQFALSGSYAGITDK